MYPNKPNKVPQLISKRTGKQFTSHNHTQAWKHYKVRPRAGTKHPENTNKEFCLYHNAHKDYTYSDAWVDKLAKSVAADDEFAKIKAVKN